MMSRFQVLCVFTDVANPVAIVADDADAICYFNTVSEVESRGIRSAASSVAESVAASKDPFDFTVYTDQVNGNRLSFNT